MTGSGVTIYDAADAAVANDHLYVAGNDADFEITTPQNVGLYGFAQSGPGQIQPDRYAGQPRVANEPAAEAAEPMKSQVLNGREPAEKPDAPPLGGRPFRQARPPNYRM